MNDIYFDKNYGKLYEKIEKGEAFVFTCQTKNGVVINQFIKRKIPYSINNITYYDIVTPYGYGGPIVMQCNGDRESLIVEYFKEFSSYCYNNNIVAEFVRFHPLADNAKDFMKIYNAQLNRHTLGTNLKMYDDPIMAEFSKSCRQNIKKKLTLGMTFKVTENPSDFTSFKRAYYSTMDRNEASDYYYFDDDYFNLIHKYFGNNTILVETFFNNEVIASGLYFISNKIIHVHLSGTLKEYLNLSPAYILRYAITMWGKENGYEMIHHGGGRTASREDTLFQFKKQFAKNTEFEFYLGKKIWNQEVYNELCQAADVDKDEEFFPAYRRVLK